MPTLFIDIESRSACNLKTRGAWRYASDPSTEPLMLCWAVDDGEVVTWRSGDPVPAPFIAASNTDGWEVVAHNWDFERFFYELILIPRFGFPPIPLDRWHCSMRLALANAYPAELGLLSQALGLPYRKDPKALRALNAVSRPRKNKSWDEDPDKLALVHERCVTDVIAMRACWQHPKLRPLSEDERRLQLIDAEINARGVRIDREFVTAARAFAAAERNAVNIRLSDLTDGQVTSIDQVQKLRAAINARGHELTSLSKRSVAAALAHDPDEVTRQLLTLRRDGARASVRKFNRILEYTDDAMTGYAALFAYMALRPAAGRRPDRNCITSRATTSGRRCRSSTRCAAATAPISRNSAIRSPCSAAFRARYCARSRGISLSCSRPAHDRRACHRLGRR